LGSLDPAHNPGLSHAYEPARADIARRRTRWKAKSALFRRSVVRFSLRPSVTSR